MFTFWMEISWWIQRHRWKGTITYLEHKLKSLELLILVTIHKITRSLFVTFWKLFIAAILNWDWLGDSPCTSIGFSDNRIRGKCKLDVNEPAEENLKFKHDVSKKLEVITSRQQKFADSLSTITREVQAKNVNNKFEGMKSTLNTVETSCSDLKKNVEKNSASTKKDCHEIKTIGKQINEAAAEVRHESRRTREQVTEMEKSLAAISEAEKFSTKNAKTKKTTTESTQTDNRENSGDAAERDCDVEITYANVSTANTRVPDPSNHVTNDVTLSNSTQTKKSDDGEINRNRQGSRKQKVYIIGDSIAGQVNVPVLGKSTNTYVRRLRVPKIRDIGTHAEEIKDARLIIIHIGINNLQDKESTEACVNELVQAITSLKESAPEAKITVSKLIPVGDRDLATDSTMPNASCEKKLREIHSNISFVDHGSLAEHGVPLKAYYRHDMLHLSYSVVVNFGGNLRKAIDNALNQKETDANKRVTDQPGGGGEPFSERNYRYEHNRRQTDEMVIENLRDRQY